jgi:hypothetical protein
MRLTAILSLTLLSSAYAAKLEKRDDIRREAITMKNGLVCVYLLITFISITRFLLFFIGLWEYKSW